MFDDNGAYIPVGCTIPLLALALAVLAVLL